MAVTLPYCSVSFPDACCMYLSLLSVGIGCGATHILLHKGDVVVLFQVSVFLQVGSVVLGHSPNQIFYKFVGNE